MNRLRDNYRTHPKTGRATELDPATFAHAEELQGEDRGLDWLFICTWGGMFLVAGLAWWGIYAAVAWAWTALNF